MTTIPVKNQNTSLTQTASRSVFWSLFGTLGVSALRFVSTAILARILMPEDFGIIGMAMIFTGIVTLFGKLGMGAALVQRKEIDQEYLSTAFWTGLAVGVLLSLMAIATAPLIALFFKEPILRVIVMWLSINFIFSALASIHATLLHRELNFKSLSIIEITSTIVRITFILTCALLGMGVWSIVIGMIADRVLKTFLIIRKVQWIPSLKFSAKKEIKSSH